MNKLGLAAPTGSLLDLQGAEDKEVTEEELRRKQQVKEFVAKLTPEQVVLQQKRVQVRISNINWALYRKVITCHLFSTTMWLYLLPLCCDRS